MAKVYGLNESDIRKIKKLIRESGSSRSQQSLARRTRLGSTGGSRRGPTAGVSASVALCVNDIPRAEIPNLAGMDIATWTITVGQAGPPPDRSSAFGEDGTVIQPYTGKQGAVLLDFKRTNTTKEEYLESPYDPSFTEWAPIVEAFGDGTYYIGGGLGGTDGTGPSGPGSAYQGSAGGGI